MTVEAIICGEIITTGSNKLELQTIIDTIEAFAPMAIGVNRKVQRASFYQYH